MAIEQRLTELGYTELTDGTFELNLLSGDPGDNLHWLIEIDAAGYVLSEWTDMMWRMLAIVRDGDFLVTMLEAIGATQCT